MRGDSSHARSSPKRLQNPCQGFSSKTSVHSTWSNLHLDVWWQVEAAEESDLVPGWLRSACTTEGKANITYPAMAYGPLWLSLLKGDLHQWPGLPGRLLMSLGRCC